MTSMGHDEKYGNISTSIFHLRRHRNTTTGFTVNNAGFVMRAQQVRRYPE